MDELAKQFAALAEKFGPRVVDAALGAARMEAVSQLVGSVMWVGVSVAVALVGRQWWRCSSKENDPFGNETELRVIAYIAFFVSGVLLLPAIWAWIDPWTWTALTHPELWVAKRAFHI